MTGSGEASGGGGGLRAAASDNSALIGDGSKNKSVESPTNNSIALWKRRLKKIGSHFGLFFTLVLYTVCGGLVFKELEYPTEVATLVAHGKTVRQKRTDFLQTVIKKQNETLEEFLEHLERELHVYEIAVQEAAEAGILVPLSEGTSPIQLARWNRLQAIFFASTVLTTIGYGNICPVTFAGRLFCLLFALIGIPLCVSVIADLGSIVANSVNGLPSWLDGISIAVKSLVSAVAALLLLLMYIAVGAILFMFLEDDWSFFDSFYFCFITMTTIGFGDLVPEKPEYMLLCTIYILIGLGLTSTIIEIVRNEYAQSWKRLQALAEAVRRLGETGAVLADVNLQNDLKKALTALKKSNAASGGWGDDDAFDRIIRAMDSASNKREPKLIQIIVYESSV